MKDNSIHINTEEAKLFGIVFKDSRMYLDINYKGIEEGHYTAGGGTYLSKDQARELGEWLLKKSEK